jgi:lysophospholipase L1-like esterase
MPLNLNAATRLLFVGDSITDCDRRNDDERVGFGYVRIVRDWLRARDPANAPVVINAGISGNKVIDLDARWETDVIAQEPDVVSVMIGINDVWHGLVPEWGPGVALEPFIETYRAILTQLRAQKPACRLVLCEPTVISPPAPRQGNDLLQPYVRAVNDLAQDLLADAVVRVHDIFRAAEQARPDIEWTVDGVHPTTAGHTVIARAWLEGTGLV